MEAARVLTPSCLEYALYYAALGWPVVALNWPMPNGKCSCGRVECASIGKHPHAVCPRGAYSATTDEAIIRKWWTDFPDLNVGIVLDQHRFVVDVDPRNGGDFSWDEIKDEIGLGEGPMCFTGGGGQHFYGYSDTPLRAGELGKGIDFKAGPGALVVAPPSRHVSGGVYEWELSSQPDIKLPEATPAIIKYFETTEKTISGTLLNLDLARVRLSPEITLMPAGARNTGMSRLIGRWIACGLKPDEVGLLAQGANSRYCSPPLQDSEVQGIIESIYRTDASNNPDRYASVTVDVSRSEEAAEYPAHLLNPGGILQSIMTYVEESSAVSHPVYALAGALVLLGAVAGERVVTQSGLRTHIYALVLGYSGSGKNAPQYTLPQLLNASPILQGLKGPDDITSGPAVLRHMATHNVTACFLDEIGHLFAAMQNEKSHLANLSGDFMRIYSRAGSVFDKPYSDTKTNIIIKRPHLSFLGCSTPSKFWASVTNTNYSEGLIPRSLVFQSEHAGVEPKETIRHEMDLSLVKCLEDIRMIQQIPIPGANLEGSPHAISFDAKASECMRAAQREWFAIREKYRDNDQLSPFYSRCAEHAKKVSLIHAVSLYGPDILTHRIEEASVSWAVDLINHLTTFHVGQMRKNVSEGAWHAIQQRICKFIERKKTADKPGVTMRDLARQLPDIKRVDLDAAVRDLTKSKQTHMFYPWRGANGKDTEILIEDHNGKD
jgi:hypothetical protein